MKRSMARLAAWALGLVAGVASGTGAACRGDAAAEKDPLSVVTTTGLIGDAARNIGGDRVAVTSLMGEGVDPHLYKASPGDLRLMTRAGLVLYNGLHLEGRMADALEKLGEKKPVEAVAGNLPKDQLRQPPEFGGNYDPHIWFDVTLWMKVVERTRDVLVEHDAAGREVYAANAARHLAELKTLDSWVREQMGRIPKERRVLVTAHDAFGYFGRAYGVEVMAIQGISTDSEASIKTMNTLVDTLVQRKIPAVFVESSVPRKTIDALVEGCKGRGHPLKVGGELFSDALGKDGTPEGTYIGMVKHNVNTIVHALAPSEGSAAPAANPASDHGAGGR